MSIIELFIPEYKFSQINIALIFQDKKVNIFIFQIFKSRAAKGFKWPPSSDKCGEKLLLPCHQYNSTTTPNLQEHLC